MVSILMISPRYNQKDEEYQADKENASTQQKGRNAIIDQGQDNGGDTHGLGQAKPQFQIGVRNPEIVELVVIE